MQGGKIPTSNIRKCSTLVIGRLPKFGRNSKNVTYASTMNSSPTLFDYEIIYVKYSNPSFYRTYVEKWQELKKFFLAGGILCIIGFDKTIMRFSSNLSNSKMPLMIAKKGQKVSWVRGTRVYEALKEFGEADYDAIIQKQEEKEIGVIGRSASNEAIAFEIDSGRGRILFLPNFDISTRSKVMKRLQITFTKQITQLSSNINKPVWLDTISLKTEKVIQNEIEDARNRLSKLDDAKKIIYEEGKSLSRECANLLEQMLKDEGCSVLWKEESGQHDIEIRNKSIILVVEVRASNRLVDVDLARQLLDHIQLVEDKELNKKGIIIANAFRQVSPKERKKSFSRECIDIARRNNFCLINTTQLLYNYDLIIANELKPQEFVTRIIECNGEFE